MIAPDRPTGTSFRVQVGTSASANIVIAILGVISGAIAARFLGPAGRGELAAIQTWGVTIAAFGVVGLPEALVYFTARDKNHAAEHTATALALAVITSIPFAVAGYVLMPYLLAEREGFVVAAARWYLLIIPVSVLAGMPLHALRGISDFTIWNVCRTLPNLGWVILLLLAVSIGIGPTGIAKGHVLLIALLAGPFLLITRRRIRGSAKIDTSLWPAMLRFGLPNALTAVPHLINLRLDQLVMAGLFQRGPLGLYVVAVAWGAAVQPLLAAFSHVLFPRIAASTPADRTETFVRGTRISIAAAVLLVGGGLLATPWGLPLVFGSAFRGAVPAALVLVVASGVLGVGLVLEDSARGLGKPHLVLRAETLGAVVTAVSLAGLLPLLGIEGAAIASLLGYSTVLLMLLRTLARGADLRMMDLLKPEWGPLWQAARSLKR